MERLLSAEMPDFLAGGGEMGRLIQSMNWSRSPLGPIESWPQSLLTTVSLCLASTFPISMAWGPQHVQIYNDGYWPICGGKHPRSMGQDYTECWASAWPVIGEAFDRGLAGEASYIENQRMFLDRNGYLEETFFTFSFSPIRDESGRVGGLFHPVTEQTSKLLSERRTRALRDLTAGLSTAKAIEDVFVLAARTLSDYTFDIPFAFFYLLDSDGKTARLAASTGLDRAPNITSELITLGTQHLWPIDEVVRSARSVSITRLVAALRAGSVGPYDEAPDRAIALPITAPGSTRPMAVMVAGVSSRLPLDEMYRGFFDLLASTVTAAMGNALAYQDERKRAEALAEIDRAKTAFFSNVSHEFRTPLTLMLGPLQEALDDLEAKLVPAQRDRLEVAHRNALRLLKLVNTLLDFSRIEAGRIQARFEPTDLAALTAELASNFRSACEKAGLALVVDCPPLRQPVYVDRDMWEKIILNLLSNAFKFTFNGEIRVGLALIDGDRAELTVRDTGTGISAEELPKLFDRFHRVEGAKGRSVEGSGIGLALVQELVTLHGGTVRAASEVDRGTTFTIEMPLGASHLPADHVHDAPISAPRADAAGAFVEEALRWLPDGPADRPHEKIERPGRVSGFVAALSAGGDFGETPPRIVLADDNADMRGYIRRLLDAAGYQVDAFPDGAAALEACLAAPPDLLVTDVMMPGLDGFGLLQRMRKDPTTSVTPVILLSARAGEEARIEGLRAGADDYLVKPFGEHELLARVEAAIRLVQLRRASILREHELEAELATARARAVLNESNERLHLALEAGGLGTWELDLTTGIATGSRVHDGIFGYAEPPPDWGYEAFSRHILEEDRERVATSVDSGIKTGTGWQLECRITRTDGEIRWIAVFARALRSADGTVERMLGVIKDVTDSRETEASLRQAQKMEAIGNLTGGLAHDFNNLLGVIIGNLDILGDEVTGEAQLDLIKEAVGAAWSGADLTKRLLAFARRQPLQPKDVGVNELVARTAQLMQRLLGADIEISLQLATDVWGIRVDPAQLEAALVNLGTNARDAMPRGGKLTITTQNCHLDRQDVKSHADVATGDYAVIEVSDTGTGMSRETADRIFEPFFTTKQLGAGTGLGLSMVFGFVKQSAGHVSVDSEEGAGTSVRLYLPRIANSASSGPQKTNAAFNKGGSETILVVEDNPALRRLVVRQIRLLGYHVLDCDNPAAGLALLEKEEVDLLLTDIVMPGGQDGVELAQIAQKRWPTLKVILTSGYPQARFNAEGMLGSLQLLSKPYEQAQLAKMIRTTLDH